MEEQSSVAISQALMTPRYARFLSFDSAFPVPGDGDSLTVTLGGTRILSLLGTDFPSGNLSSSGPLNILAFAGQTSSELSFTLESVGEPGATVLLDNVQVFLAGDVDFDRDVDLNDHGVLVNTMTGPDQPIVPAGARTADLDGDNDCDLRDVLVFQTTFAGPSP